MSRAIFVSLSRVWSYIYQRRYSAFEFGAFFACAEMSRDSADALQAAPAAWTWRDARCVSVPRASIVFCSFLASPGLHLESTQGGRESPPPADARADEKRRRDKSAFFLPSPRTKIPLIRMADDSHENGTSNGDVPEIELIIKVSVPRAVANRQRDRRLARGGEDAKRKKKEAIVPCALWAWSCT